MKTGRDVVIGALLGAEEFGFATAPLVVMGCVMMRVCHLDTCPVGIATQNPTLRAKFTGQAEHVVNFFHFIAEEVRELMAQLGFRTIDEMVGRVDLLDVATGRRPLEGARASTSRASSTRRTSSAPKASTPPVLHRTVKQQVDLASVLDAKLIALAEPALDRREKVTIDAADPQRRSHGRHDARQRGQPPARRRRASRDDTIDISFTGSAGQSFGAFLPAGITLRLEGDANDYVGKGLSGGRVDRAAAARRAVRGRATTSSSATSRSTARRAARRSSAAWSASGSRSATAAPSAVVEGVGDHGCEYMTGGRVVVLGRTGRNFAAGMSGGVAYVLDEDGDFAQRCNMRDGAARRPRRRGRALPCANCSSGTAR